MSGLQIHFLFALALCNVSFKDLYLDNMRRVEYSRSGSSSKDLFFLIIVFIDRMHIYLVVHVNVNVYATTLMLQGHKVLSSWMVMSHLPTTAKTHAF